MVRGHEAKTENKQTNNKKIMASISWIQIAIVFDCLQYKHTGNRHLKLRLKNMIYLYRFNVLLAKESTTGLSIPGILGFTKYTSHVISVEAPDPDP